mmetsp:Transcript_15219/g.22129  ORF Transcript_15219/g.22129 Transcript_15219/m.22129 type:complete len:223 (-) Transcript_15219:309-977(-)
MRHCFRRARPRHSSCLWPWLKLSPFSDTGASRRAVNSSMTLLMLQPSSASQISPSVCSPNGSMLLRTVPEKRTGFCGIIPILLRRSFKPMRRMSIPSIIIGAWYSSSETFAGSTILKSVRSREDLPLPVRPTTPILDPPSILTFSPLMTNGVSGRYLISKLVRVMVPLDGQPEGVVSAPAIAFTAILHGGKVSSSVVELPSLFINGFKFSLLEGASCEIFSV